jgi:hypothetical protein
MAISSDIDNGNEFESIFMAFETLIYESSALRGRYFQKFQKYAGCLLWSTVCNWAVAFSENQTVRLATSPNIALQPHRLCFHEMEMFSGEFASSLRQNLSTTEN